MILGRLRPQIELHSRPISWSCPNCNLSSTFSQYRLFAVFASSISAVVNPSIDTDAASIATSTFSNSFFDFHYLIANRREASIDRTFATRPAFFKYASD